MMNLPAPAKQSPRADEQKRGQLNDQEALHNRQTPPPHRPARFVGDSVMVIVTFPAYLAKRTLRFTCLCCGAKGRTKTIKHECTVNPFNVDDHGIPLGPDAVRVQSREKVEKSCDEFLREPYCKKCEDGLSYGERRDLYARRRVAEDTP